MGAFEDLGKALRWLRTRQDRKQYEIANSAGITKAMLSAYETGKQNPSIETLEKILAALNVNLMDLHNALRVNHREEAKRVDENVAWGHFPRQRTSPFATEPRSNLYHILDVDEPLPAEQEFAFSQMLAGFHSVVRHMYKEMKRTGSETPPETKDGDGGEGEEDGAGEK